MQGRHNPGVVYIPCTPDRWWPGLGQLSVSFTAPRRPGLGPVTGSLLTLHGLSRADFADRPHGRVPIGCKVLFACHKDAQGRLQVLGHEMWTQSLEDSYVLGGFHVLGRSPVVPSPYALMA